MISLIIPTYNSEKYIERCYKSICIQTYSDWEAVFVDDGSVDNSRILLDSLAETDSRVKVVSKVNEGVAVARQWGIEASKGQYITFLDIDDELLPEALDILMAGFSEDDIDIVIGGMQLTRDGKICKRITYKNAVISGVECFKMLCCGTLRWQLWGKAYRRTLFDNIVTPNGLKVGQDMAACLQVALRAARVRVLDCVVYDYVQNSSSVSHTRLEVNTIDALRSALFVECVLQKEIERYDLYSDVDSMYMLCVSVALNRGISYDNNYLQDSLASHFSFRALRRINWLKAINIAVFKYLHINLASYR